MWFFLSHDKFSQGLCTVFQHLFYQKQNPDDRDRPSFANKSDELPTSRSHPLSTTILKQQ